MKSTMIDDSRKARVFLLGVLLLGMMIFGGFRPLLAGEQTPVASPPALKVESPAKTTVPEAVSKTTVCKSELFRHISKLASDGFKGRDPAGGGGMMAAKYLAAEFKKLGLKPNGDNGKYFQNFTGSRAKSALWSNGKHISSKKGIHATARTAVEGHTASSDRGSGGSHGEEKKSGDKDGDEGEGDEEGDNPKPPMSDEQMEEAAKKMGDWLSRKFGGAPRKVKHREFSCRNVLGVLPGSDPDLKDEVIVVSAHYDHLGVRCGQIYNGADDNASGTASMLEVARVLANRKQRPRRTILFAAWDGEEKGLLGSSHWSQSPTIPIDQVVAVINLDMIGRLRHDKLLVLGSGSSDQLTDIIRSRARRSKLKLLEWKKGGNSDHWPFCVAGISSVTFCTGIHRDYHAPTDDVNLVHFDGLQRIARMTLGLVCELANRDARVEFTCNR